jgi:acetoin utilization deacetylase AcuC-like enzyme
MSTGFVFDPKYLDHDEPSHPENRTRLDSVLEDLERTELVDRLQALEARDATEQEITRVHDPHYVRRIETLAQQRGWFDADTYLTPDSYDAAMRAAGGVIVASEAVVRGDVQNAFALVRPPGHHAVADRAMGFCLFNNIAVAARHMLTSHGLSRVLIVDFDLHHGNGTQAAFYEEPQVMYFSTHQFPYYPGTGHWQEMGRGAGRGYTVNVPLPAGVDDAGYHRVVEQVLLPVASRYRPQLIMASAGYDGHWMDPLGMMRLSVRCYADIVGALVALADEHCGGKLVLTLEGGYSLPALTHCVHATFEVLLGEERVDDPLGPAKERGASVDDVIRSVKKAHALPSSLGI